MEPINKTVKKTGTKIRKFFRRIGRWFHQLPDRKRYLDFVAGILGIPALILVLILNYNNLQSAKKTPTQNPAQQTTPDNRPIIIQSSPAKDTSAGGNTQLNTTTTPEACKKQIGPISISYPAENATITDNPLNIIISYDNSAYCTVVWSYRINGGQWSEYTSNSISLYNMPAGNKKLDLRIQSTVSGDQTMISRDFIYQPENTSSASNSATTQ